MSNINPYALYYLLDETPPQFIEEPIIKEYNRICIELDVRNYNAEYGSLDAFSYPFSIEKSILGGFGQSKDQLINKAAKAWLQCAQYDFDTIKEAIYSPCLWKSIDALKLAEMEQRELDRFFESGVSRCMAVNAEEGIFRYELSPAEIFEYYLQLLRGQYEFFIIKNDYENFCNLHRAIGDEFISTSLSEQNNNPDYGLALERGKAADRALKKDWWLAARVQALLWLVDHLKSVINSRKKSEIKLELPKISMDDLSSHGFQVFTPEKTLPALHEALIRNSLIKDEDLESFKNAFEQGKGIIIWRGSQSHLGYFISRIKEKGIILNNENWIPTASIFKLNNGRSVNIGSMKSSAKELAESKKKLIDNIVQEIITLR